jgi:hypothetical protein
MALNSHPITDKPSLDAVTEYAKATPTFIYIHNSSLPIYKTFTPIFEETIRDTRNEGIRFCRMDYDSATSSMMKFAPNQMPVLVAMYGTNWCRTILGADRKGLSEMVKELREKIERQ